MSQFRIIPLSTTVVDSIRTTRRDAFENLVLEQIATGYGPCRLSLEPFQPGADHRMNFTQLVGNQDVDVLIRIVFDGRPDVAYLHMRNAEACCYICAVERA